MSIIRLTFAVLISIGLALTPVQAARMMPLDAGSSLIQSSAQLTPTSNQKCACCKFAAQCVMALCTISCPQLSQVSAAPNDFAVIGHAVFAGLPPRQREGLGRRPPIPPPRA